MTAPGRGAAFVVRSQRVVTPDGVRPAAVHVRAGSIERVTAHDDVPDELSLLEAENLVVMAGLVDTHVHVNEPGRTEWEGFRSATRAAVAGGVTTLLDMPLNAIPATTTVAALEIKRAAARGNCSADVGFLGGVVPGNSADLAALHDAGVLGFKCFLAPSGVDEFPHVGGRDLADAFPVLARLGAVLMVHAEDPAQLGGRPADGSTSYQSYLASRPPAAEASAIAMLAALMERWPVRVHIVHLSSAAGLAAVRAARARGLPMTAETCPHYLTFAAEEIPAGHTEYKCAPPIRGRAEREALWRGLVDGEIGMIVSDHSPAPPAMKATGGDFFGAWGGIASLQLGLSAVWTMASARGIGIDHVARWMCEAPAALVGLDSRKGRLVAGADADLVIWDAESTWLVDGDQLQHRHPLTPYADRTLRGVVHATYLRGEPAYQSDRFKPARGELLVRSRPPDHPHA